MAEVLAVVGGVSTVIGLIDPLINRLNELANRVKQFIEHPHSFERAHKKLKDLKAILENVKKMHNETKDSLQSDVRRNFDLVLAQLDTELHEIQPPLKTLEDLFLKGPAILTRRWIRKLQRRFCSAATVESTIKQITDVTKESMGYCVTLPGFLGIAYRPPEADDLPAETEFNPAYDVDNLPQHVLLDFNINLSSSYPLTPEANLKKKLMEMVSSSRSQLTPVLGVCGMGGIGKTIALTGLGWDDDVRQRFKDGIYFMRFGMDADDGVVRTQLARLVRAALGELKAREIETSVSAEDAAEQVALIFKNRKVLFLCDDLWCTEKRKDGWFDVLQRLLRFAKESCMIITTRDESVAGRAHEMVPFSARTEISECQGILLKSANTKVGRRVGPLKFEDHKVVLEVVLRHCAGVPLTLAVTGKALAELRSTQNSWKEALEAYLTKFDNGTDILGRTVSGYPSNFERTVHTSLRIADDWATMRHEGNISASLSISSLLTRFCVFERQAVVPHFVLRKLWHEIDESTVRAYQQKLVQLSLLVMVSDADVDIGVRFHDHILTFCEEVSQHQRMGDNEESMFVVHHKEFLNSYIVERSILVENDYTSSCLGECTREWWKCDPSDDDGFLFTHVIRILLKAKLSVEAIGLLTSAHWTAVIIEEEDVGSLLDDFDRVINLATTDPINRIKASGLDGLRTLRDVISDMGSYIQHNIEELLFQTYARLMSFSDKVDIQRFMTSASDLSHGTWLRPKEQCWPKPSGKRFIEVQTAPRAEHIAVDWDVNNFFITNPRNFQEIDVRAQRIIRSVPMEFRIQALSQDGRFVAMYDDHNSDFIHIWDTSKDMIHCKIQPHHARRPSETCWSADGIILVFAIRTMTDEHYLEGFNVSLGQSVFRKSAGEHATYSLAMTGDGSLLVVGSMKGRVTICDNRGSEIWRQNLDSGPIRKLSMCTDGSMLASLSSERIHVFRISSKGAYFQCQNIYQLECSFHTSRLLFSADGDFLLYNGRGGALSKAEANKGIIVASTNVPHETVRELAISPDGRFVFSCSYYGSAWLWDSSIDVPQSLVSQDSSPRAITNVQLVMNYEKVVFQNENAIKISDISARSSSRMLVRGTHFTSSPKDVTHLVYEYDGFLHWWDLKSGNLNHRRQHGRSVDGLCMSRSGALIISFGYGIVNSDTMLQSGERKREEERQLKKYSGDSFSSLMFKFWSSDGDLHGCFVPEISEIGMTNPIVISDNLSRMACGINKKLQIRELDSGFLKDKQGAAIVLIHELITSMEITSLTMSADGELVLWGEDNGIIKVWQWLKKQIVWGSRIVFNNWVTPMLSMSKDGRSFVSVGKDRKARVWDAVGPPGPGRDGNLAMSGYEVSAVVTLPECLECLDYSTERHGLQNETVVVGDKRGRLMMFDVIRNRDQYRIL